MANPTPVTAIGIACLLAATGILTRATAPRPTTDDASTPAR